MSTWQVLTTAWDWEPTVLVGCAAAVAAYGLVVRPFTRRALVFLAGMLVLLLALVSPLDTLGDRYLFSAHMLQHLLLMMVVPPLLLFGIPPCAFERLLRWGPADRAERVLGRPLLAWWLGIGTLWVWHAPALYDAALRHEGIHVVQHLSFLVTWTIFWWPIVAPLPERRQANALWTAVYMLLGSMASSLLGVFVSFAPPGLYPFYQHPVDTLHILPLIRHGWGLSYAGDQLLGGGMMWTAGSPIFVLALVWVLHQWYWEPEPDLVEVRRQWAEQTAHDGDPAMPPRTAAGQPCTVAASPHLSVVRLEAATREDDRKKALV